MSKSKIAIVVAGAYNGNAQARLVDAGRLTAGFGAMPLNIPCFQSMDNIEDILDLVDGVLLICQEPRKDPDNDLPVYFEDKFARAFCRRALDKGVNPVAVWGERAFLGSEKEFKDWAYFQRSTAKELSCQDDLFIEELRNFVSFAGTKSAFSRLARQNSCNFPGPILSPVTQG